MKKYLFIGITLVVLGFHLGNKIFNTKSNLLKIIKKENEYYFLQEGVYSSKDNIASNIKHITPKIIKKEDNNYHVYVGITKNKKIAEKLKRIFQKKGYPIIIKTKERVPEEFSINVEQFDLLINSTNDESEILTIEEVVLANYEESIKNISKIDNS